MRTRVKNGDIDAPLLELFGSFAAIKNPQVRQSVYETAKASNLSKAVLSQAENHHNFYKKANSEAAKGDIVKGAAIVSDLISKAYSVTRLDDLNIEKWIEITNSVKDESGRYVGGLLERFRVGLRKVGLALELHHSDRNFSAVAKSSRAWSQLIASHESTSLPAPEYNHWLILFQEFVDEENLKSTKSYYGAFTLFYKFLLTEKDSENPLRYMTRSARGSFFDYCQSNHTNPKEHLRRIENFGNWLIDAHLTEYDEDSGEYTRIGFPIFSPSELRKIGSDKYSSNRPSESVKAAMPTAWLLKCKQIISENDFEWPKSLSSEYFEYLSESGGTERVWIPTISYLFLVMLNLPIRKIQVASLDSGEGDEEVFDRSKKKWVNNTSRHRNYWTKIGSRFRNRGVVKNIHSATENSTGFFINTNKTQDRETGFSETSGYTIPWYNPELIDLFYDLRQWQEKYNPVPKPTAYRDIPKQVFQMTPSQSVLDLIPDRFYLFRSPRSVDSLSPDCPPTDNQIRNYWNKLMEELENRLREEGQDVEIVLKRNKNSNIPEKTIFTPHGLRVAGLTALAESGVPIEVLSKVVAGHATILMTLYYIKMDSGHISDQLNQAKKAIEQGQQENGDFQPSCPNDRI